jgi:hypothetical protein
MRGRDFATYGGICIAFATATAVIWPPPEAFLTPPAIVILFAGVLALANSSGVLLSMKRWPRTRSGRLIAWVALVIGLSVETLLAPWLRPFMAWLAASAVIGCLFGVVARSIAVAETSPPRSRPATRP